MTKWEYCVVGPIKDNFMGYFPNLRSLTLEGRRGFDIKKSKDWEEGDVLACHIARLGEDGWELVGCGSCGGEVTRTHLLYFKRPKQEGE